MNQKPTWVWKSMDQDTFERIVEVLVHREHPDGVVRVIDGRGGDGGKDVDVLDGGRRIIYQLKFFPEGFAGAWVKRRPQIKKSFYDVKDEEPHKWILVSPNKFTPSEWAYLSGLASDQHPTAITAWDQAALDSRLTKHADVVGMIQRTDELERLVTLYRQETAALTEPARDIAQRVRDLGELGDTIDPYWALDFERRGSRVIQTLRAKDPRSHEIQPVFINFTAASVGADDPLHRVLGWGASESLTLAGDQIQEFAVTGTALLSALGMPDEIRFYPAEQEARPCLVDLLAEDGSRIHRYRADVTHVGRGHQGTSLHVQVRGVITAKFLIPADTTNNKMRAGFSIDLPEECTPHQAATAAALIEQLLIAPRLKLFTATELMFLSISGDPSGAKDEFLIQVRALQQMADDLAMISTHLRVDLSMPDSATDLDRIRLRVLRHALEGKVSLDPTLDGFTIVMPPDALDEAAAPALSGEPFANFIQVPARTETVAGMELDLPELAYWHPHVAVDGTPEDLERFRDQRAQGQPLTLRIQSQDHTNLRVYILGRVTDGETQPVPWGLEGIPEPPGVSNDAGIQGVTQVVTDERASH